MPDSPGAVAEPPVIAAEVVEPVVDETPVDQTGETPAETTPAVTPAAATPPPIAQPPVDADAIRRQVEAQYQAISQRNQMEAQQEQLRLQQRSNQDIQNLAAYRDQLAAKYEPEVVSDLVRREAERIAAHRDGEDRMQVEVRTHQGTLMAAQHFSTQYGIPAQLLTGSSSPGEMETRGALWQRNKQLQEANAEIARLKQGQVKPIKLASTSAGAGSLGVTKDNIDKLWLEGKVSDRAYARFTDSGQLP